MRILLGRTQIIKMLGTTISSSLLEQDTELAVAASLGREHLRVTAPPFKKLKQCSKVVALNLSRMLKNILYVNLFLKFIIYIYI